MFELIFESNLAQFEMILLKVWCPLLSALLNSLHLETLAFAFQPIWQALLIKRLMGFNFKHNGWGVWSLDFWVQTIGCPSGTCFTKHLKFAETLCTPSCRFSKGFEWALKTDNFCRKQLPSVLIFALSPGRVDIGIEAFAFRLLTIRNKCQPLSLQILNFASRLRAPRDL